MMTLRSFGLAGAAMLAAAAACARSDLLGIQTPDAITPNNLNSADGAEGLRVGAIQRFKLMTPLDESSWFYGGMLVDEWKSADTLIQRDETDQRTVSEENSLVTTAYRDIHRARLQAFRALVGPGQQPQPGTAIAAIPKTFSFNLTWPGTQGKEDNLIGGLATSALRYTMEDSLDRQGGVIPHAMPFVSAKDPRVPAVQNP